MAIASEPGVYRSDVEGHLFVLQLDPVSVTCVVCMEACHLGVYRSSDRKAIAGAFVEKHGALSGKIADSLLQLIPTSNEPKP